MRKDVFARCLLSAVAFLFLFLAAGLCRADDHEGGTKESYKVTLTFDGGRPVFGKNHVKITVADASSAPVTGAAVKVSYFMPSLRGRPPMMGRSATARPSGDGYEATLDFSMKGEWRVIVSVATLANTEEVAFAYIVE